MKIVIPILIAVVLCFLLFLLLTISEFYSLFRRSKDEKKADASFQKSIKKTGAESYLPALEKSKDALKEKRYKKTSIYGFDEVSLYGRLYAPAQSGNTKTVLLCHALRHGGEADFGKLVSFYQNNGYHVLLFHQRAHGRSGGKYASAGLAESADIVAWCQWLEMRFGTGSPIVIHGVSMGAFAALQAAASSNLPKNVTKIIAESVYKNIHAYTSFFCRKKTAFLLKPRLFFIRRFYKSVFHADMRSLSASKAIRQTKIPVLLIHGEKDGITPWESVVNLVRQSPCPIPPVLIKNAPHAMCRFENAAQTERAIKEFLGI